MSDKTTYESLDNRIAPEALTEDHIVREKTEKFLL